MNERIRELAVEANSQTGNKFDLNYKELDAFLEKFAELIVNECCDVLDPGTLQIFAGYQARKYLVEHFGVEE